MSFESKLKDIVREAEKITGETERARRKDRELVLPTKDKYGNILRNDKREVINKIEKFKERDVSILEGMQKLFAEEVKGKENKTEKLIKLLTTLIDFKNKALPKVEGFSTPVLDLSHLKLDLSGAELRNLDLSNLNLSGWNFSGARMEKVNFNNTNLAKADFSRIRDPRRPDLRATGLQGATFGEGANVVDVNFTEANLFEATFSKTLFSEKTKFTNAEMTRVKFNECDLIGVNFSDVNTTACKFKSCLVDINKLDELRDSGTKEDIQRITKVRSISRRANSAKEPVDLKKVRALLQKNQPQRKVATLSNIPVDPNTFDFRAPGINLKEYDFKGWDLKGKDLSGLDFSGVDFTGCDLRGVELSGSIFIGAIFTNAQLEAAVFNESKLSGVDFSVVQNNNLTKVNFNNAEMIGVNLSGLRLTDSDFIDADLTKSKWEETPLKSINLQGACLDHVDLSTRDLENLDLKGCSLGGVNFSGAYLKNVNFSGAYLEGAVFTGANIKDANFFLAITIGAKLGNLKSVSEGQFSLCIDRQENFIPMWNQVKDHAFTQDQDGKFVVKKEYAYLGRYAGILIESEEKKVLIEKAIEIEEAKEEEERKKSNSSDSSESMPTLDLDNLEIPEKIKGELLATHAPSQPNTPVKYKASGSEEELSSSIISSNEAKRRSRRESSKVRLSAITKKLAGKKDEVEISSPTNFTDKSKQLISAPELKSTTFSSEQEEKSNMLAVGNSNKNLPKPVQVPGSPIPEVKEGWVMPKTPLPPVPKGPLPSVPVKEGAAAPKTPERKIELFATDSIKAIRRDTNNRVPAFSIPFSLPSSPSKIDLDALDNGLEQLQQGLTEDKNDTMKEIDSILADERPKLKRTDTVEELTRHLSQPTRKIPVPNIQSRTSTKPAPKLPNRMQDTPVPKGKFADMVGKSPVRSGRPLPTPSPKKDFLELAKTPKELE